MWVYSCNSNCSAWCRLTGIGTGSSQLWFLPESMNKSSNTVVMLFGAHTPLLTIASAPFPPFPLNVASFALAHSPSWTTGIFFQMFPSQQSHLTHLGRTGSTWDSGMFVPMWHPLLTAFIEHFYIKNILVEIKFHFWIITYMKMNWVIEFQWIIQAAVIFESIICQSVIRSYFQLIPERKCLTSTGT